MYKQGQVKVVRFEYRFDFCYRRKKEAIVVIGAKVLGIVASGPAD